MNTVVEEANTQFATLFANTKYFVEASRARQPDPEHARLRAHYAAQLAALRDSVKRRAAGILYIYIYHYLLFSNEKSDISDRLRCIGGFEASCVDGRHS